VCKDCSERAAELNCPGGSYLGNCGGGLRSKGYCLPCAACAPGSYRTGCTDRDPGSCVPCENGTFSDTYSSAPACGDCAQECALGLMQTHDCTALQNRLCAPATCVMCPLGSFTAGCNVDLSIAGACQSCAECAPGERRVGCGALSEGACEACPARTFQPLSTAASSCLPCTEQSCAQDEFVLHECSATADRQCATCSQAALACAQGSYLQGCGGPFPGNCTACPPCEAGHFRTSCNGTSVGECVPCPSGSYNPGTGDPLACIPCTSSCNATNTSTRSSSNISQHNPTLPDLLQVPQRISALRGSPAVRKLRIRGCHVSFDCSCAHCVYASATRTHARTHAHTHTHTHTHTHSLSLSLSLSRTHSQGRCTWNQAAQALKTRSATHATTSRASLTSTASVAASRTSRANANNAPPAPLVRSTARHSVCAASRDCRPRSSAVRLLRLSRHAKMPCVRACKTDGNVEVIMIAESCG